MVEILIMNEKKKKEREWNEDETLKPIRFFSSWRRGRSVVLKKT